MKPQPPVKRIFFGWYSSIVDNERCQTAREVRDDRQRRRGGEEEGDDTRRDDKRG
jgi:hypothetical protein